MRVGQNAHRRVAANSNGNNKYKNSRNSRIGLLAVAAAAGIGFPYAALAANNDTWVGNLDATFGNGANWVATTVPANGDALFFAAAGTAGTSLDDNIVGLSISGLTFNSGAGAFTIGSVASNTLALAGNLTDSAGGVTEVLSLPILLASPSTWSVTNTATTALSAMGAIDNGGNLLTLNAGTGANGAIAISGIISDSGGLAINPANTTGSVTLTAANTYSGATTITNGALVLSGGGSVANSIVSIGSIGAASNADLNVTQSTPGTYTFAAGITGDGAVGVGGSNSFAMLMNVSGGNFVENAGALTLNGGDFRVSLAQNTAGNTQLNFSGVTRSPGSHLSFDRNAQNAGLSLGTATIASQTAGTQNVVFATAPTLVGGGGAIGTNTVSILPWATVNSTVATYDSANGVRALTSAEQATLTSGMTGLQNAKVSANTTLSANTSINSLDETNTCTIAFGAGDTLSVNSGALVAGVNLTLGNAVGNGVLALGSAEGQFFVANIRNITANSVITGSGGLTITLDDLNGTTAFVNLAAANTYTGTTTFEGNNAAMTVRVTNALALQNTTLNYNNYGASFTFGNGGTSGQTAYTFGGLEGAQNITLANNNTTPGPVALTVGGDGDSTTYSGNLLNGATTGAGGSLIFNGSGTMTLLGAGNTYTGGTTVRQGTLVLGHGGGLAANNAIILGSGVNSGTFQLGDATAANNTTVTALTTSGSGTANAIVGGNAATSTLTVNIASGTNTYAGAIGGAGTNQSNIALVKSGAGNLTLSGSSSFIGGTTVSAGNLNISGTLSGTQGITVNSGTLHLFSTGVLGSGTTVQVNPGATLGTTVAGGSGGTAQGLVTVAGGSGISGGNINLEDTVIDTLNLTGGLKVGDANGASQISLDVANNAVANDLISLGSAAFTAGTGGATINLLPLGGSIVPGTYTLMTFGSETGFTIGSNLTLSNTAPAGKTYTLQFNNTDTALQLLVTGLASPNIAFWSGINGGSFNWGDGISATNWDAAQTGATATGTPGSNTDVVFANVNAAAGSLNTQLETSYDVNSVTVLGSGFTSVTTGTVTSIGGVGSLTISGLASGTGGEGYSAGTGIVVQSGAAGLTIGATGGVIVANSQSWTNNSSNALTVSSNIQGSAAANTPATLTLSNTSSGTTVLSGTIADGSGAGSPLALTVNNTGSGVTTLSGTNTFTGTTSITTGKLDLSNTNALQDSTLNFTVANSLIFDQSIASHAFILGGLSGSANLALADNGSNAVALSLNNGSGTYSGVLSGGGSLTSIGTGELTLTNANTYTGGTTISAGTIQLGDGITANGSVTGNITDNGVLVFANPNPQTFASVISGSGAVTVSGPGTLTMTNANTHTGVTTVSGGALQFGDGVTSNESVAGNILNNAAVIFANPTAQTYSGIISGTGAVTAAGPATLTLAGLNTDTGMTTVNSAQTLQLGNGATDGAIAGNVTLNGTLVLNDINAQTLPGAIGGTGSIAVNGTGFVTLSGSSTYSGGTTFNGQGAISANSNTALGTGTVTFNGGGGTGQPVLQTTNAAGVTISNPIVYASGISYISAFQGATLTLAGPITGSGEIFVNQGGGTGIATVVFSGDNSRYTGTFILGGGSNTRFKWASTTSGSASATYILNNTTTDAAGLTYGAGSTSFGSLSGTGFLRDDAGGGVANTSTLNIGALNVDTSFSGTITTGTNSFLTVNKVGTGRLDLAGNNIWHGTAMASGGTLEIDTAIPNVTLFDVNGGTLDLSLNVTSPFVFAATQTLGGQGTVNGNIIANGPVSLGQAINTAGNTAAVLSVASGATLAGSLLEDLTAVNTSDDLVFGGGTGSANLGGTLTVTNPNTVAFAGGQSYQILSFASESGTFSTVTLPPLSANLAWNTSQLYTNGIISIISTGPASLTWNNAGADNLWNTTSSNWNSGATNTTYSDGAQVTFNDNNPSNTAANYAVTLNTTVSPASVTVNNSNGNYVIGGTGSIAGTTALSKSGTGNLTLNTVNTYTGGTNVSAGTLVAGVTGALPSGAVSITGGTLQLAPSTGLATITSLAISGTGTFDINNNHVIINYGAGPDPVASIATLLATGFAGGAWNGPGGIVSSAIAANPGYGVGYADSADLGNPAGLASGTIEVAFTLLGDADLNHIVNGVDFGILAANFNKAVSRWDQGDFNYDNIVNGIDFGALAANFNKGASSASDIAALDAFAAANGLLADVPEPASLGLLALGVVGILARRRRRK